MNNTKKLAVAVLAVAGLAGMGLTGCTRMQVADLASANGVQAPAAQGEETRVSRPLSGYGQLGGYRYRRFAAVPKAT